MPPSNFRHVRPINSLPFVVKRNGKLHFVIEMYWVKMLILIDHERYIDDDRAIHVRVDPVSLG